jgi:FkbM family methyltransferase
MFYSQQQEDKVLYEKYLDYRNGFFIELGAMNGVEFSNTLFFEKNLNWNGVLIEPTTQFEQLKINRPNCYNFNYAISEVDGDVEFLGEHALGGVLSTMHDDHKFGWGLDKKPSYFVKSKPISEVVKNIDIKTVDLFSIDVEGGEYEVLSTFDWDIKVYIVLIEMSHDKEKNEKCRNLLKSKGFEFDMVIGCNEVWINHKNNNRYK